MAHDIFFITLRRSFDVDERAKLVEKAGGIDDKFVVQVVSGFLEMRLVGWHLAEPSFLRAR